MIKKLGRLVTVGLAIAAVGLTVLLVSGYQASAHESRFRAQLRDGTGQRVGTVEFRVGRHAMTVDVELRPNTYVEENQFHGFHVHANDVATNGEGCDATGTDPATWFASADGHLSKPGQSHGAHLGDLPSPLVGADGTARLQFTTHRINPSMLRDRVVILHANPDNFGNVPTGTAADQYTRNSERATTVTANTGNAGNRVACGVIRRQR